LGEKRLIEYPLRECAGTVAARAIFSEIALTARMAGIMEMREASLKEANTIKRQIQILSQKLSRDLVKQIWPLFEHLQQR